MSYVDGYVVPVPKAKLAEYREMARQVGEIWREHGALAFVECVADDVKPGEQTSFPQSVKLKEDETVVLSWIRFESREDRDRINEAVMKDPRLCEIMDPQTLPFDGMRMFWGGFEVLVEG